MNYFVDVEAQNVVRKGAVERMFGILQTQI